MNLSEHNNIVDLFPGPVDPSVHPKFQRASQIAKTIPQIESPKAKHQAKRALIAELINALRK